MTVLLSLFLVLLCACYCFAGDDFYFLNSFEKLSYNSRHIDDVHKRIKRSANPNDAVDLKFTSHGRDFHLRLKRDNSVFSSSHVADYNGKALNDDLSFFYQGTDLNDPTAFVYGSLIDGVFDGHINSEDGSFYIEKASRYVKPESDHKFHSIIYSDNDINYEKIRIKRGGLNGNVKNWMQRVQRSALIDNNNDNIKNTDNNVNNIRIRKEDSDSDSSAKIRRHVQEPLSDSNSEAPWRKYSPDVQERQHRTVRALTVADAKTGLYSVRTCTLYLQADQKLWEHIFNHEGQRDRERTRNEIFALFNNHIKAVNAIYEGTDFNGTRGITFTVQRTTIWDNTSCPNSDLEDATKNPFCNDNVDVSNYLHLNSIKNHSDFCLAYALTYRDFIGGSLGLAWVASPQPSTSGGICEVYKPYTAERGKRVKRSLNTGIITLVNHHNRVPTKISQLTLAHEIGHNFGSPHDFPSICQPGLPDGNFIMFASATSGDKPNNAKFSRCSIANVSAVLRAVLAQPPNVDTMGAKRNCLIDATTSFCGNGIVEEGEECDCGFNEMECKERLDSCCYPKFTNDVLNPKHCKRMQGAQCSPTEGPCCNKNCSFKTAYEDVCRQSSDCSNEQKCNGRSAGCPLSESKPDRTLCQENTKICNAGNCNKSICELVGMDECFVTSGTPEDKCQLACVAKNASGTGHCLVSTSIGSLTQYFVNKTSTAENRGILLIPGSPCNEYKGYCDIFQKCRSVDSNGPLSRLKNLLINNETTAGEWV